MLIIVAILVFYNEYNKQMNIAEIGLLIIALIAIVRASMNYITLNDTAKWEWEEFTNGDSVSNTRKGGNKSKGKNKMEDAVILESNKSKEYFDTDDDGKLLKNTPKITQNMLTSLFGNKIDKDAVSQVNSILGISSPANSSYRSQSNFDDITNSTTDANITSYNKAKSDNGIDSIFVPQIQIGKSSQDSLTTGFNMQGMNMTSLSGLGVPNVSSLASTASALGAGDNMSFPNTMKPSSNLWSSNLDYMDTANNWSQSMNDYNNGKWNPKLYSKPSDYIDYYTPEAYGMSTPPSTNSIGIESVSPPTNKSNFDDVSSTTTIPQTTKPQTTKPQTTAPQTTAPQTTAPQTTAPQPTTLNLYGQPQKLCGAYDDLSLEQSGNLMVKNYSQAKKWMPGYTYVPPVYWDVPQKHVGACASANPNARKLTGLIDRGTPINALELNPDGSMADTEDTVSLTNIGSIIPKFNYQDTPFSKPYV